MHADQAAREQAWSAKRIVDRRKAALIRLGTHDFRPDAQGIAAPRRRAWRIHAADPRVQMRQLLFSSRLCRESDQIEPAGHCNVGR
jgi:hypothetical protein